jgi:ER-bound oxygenase mpaB/B'/Rubber oxygenase, catalytic domain
VFPTRFLQVDESARVHRLGHFLGKVDPLADDVVAALEGRAKAEQEALIAQLVGDGQALPAPLRRLHESIREVPFWYEPERASVGGAVVLRGGLISGFVLGFKSLVLGYCSPGGNKPLAMSRRLENDVQRRLAETARFVEAVSHPDGLAWGAAGLEAVVRVRLIHARVRLALGRTPAWRGEAWGAPINQYDMAGTVLLFSSVLLEGLESLGFSTSATERDAVVHLWRYAGRLMGVDDELLCTTPNECANLWSLLERTQALPDADSKRLADALILDGTRRGVSPAAAVDFGYALSRYLVGKRYADALGYPRSMWSVAPPLLRGVVSRLDAVSRRFPGGREQALRTGMSYWRRVVELAFGERPVEFGLPEEPIAR